MDFVTIVKAILPVDPTDFKPDAKAFQPGDHLLGRVLRRLSDGKVVMDFKSFRALTEVPMQVRVGQTLNLEVTQTGNPLKLRIVPPFHPSSGDPMQETGNKPGGLLLPDLLRQLDSDLKTLNTALSNVKTGSTAQPQSIQSALSTLSNLMSGLDMTSTPKVLAAEIQNRIENWGFLYEGKMAAALEAKADQPERVQHAIPRSVLNALVRSDLKFNALQLIEFLDKLDPERSHLEELTRQRIQHALKTILEDVGQQQHRAAKRLSTEDPFQIFQMVLPFKEEQEAAKLKIYYTRKKHKELSSNPTVSLLLDLNSLGMVRSDFMMLQRDLSVTIYVSNAELKNYVESQIGLVQKELENLFEAVSLSVRVSEKKIKSFDAPAQMEGHDHKVDLHI